MPALAEDLQLSAAGTEDGHAAFQEFLLAGERHIVAQLARPGTAEERFATVFAKLPDAMQAAATGYFRRQAQLDLSQRVALLGNFTKLNIADPLTIGTAERMRRAGSTSARSERDAMGSRTFGGRGGVFANIPGTIADAFEDAAAAFEDQRVIAVPKIRVRRVELLLLSLTVEDSQDAIFGFGDTDELTLGVTMLSDTGVVTTRVHNLGDLSEGHTKSFLQNPMTIGSILLAAGEGGFPRSFSFKVDAIERDDGSYNDLLARGAEYLQEKVTEELIARGIIAGAADLGIPIHPSSRITSRRTSRHGSTTLSTS